MWLIMFQVEDVEIPWFEL